MLNTIETSKDQLVMKPATDAAGRTSRYVSLKDYAGAEVTVYVNQANAATILVSLLQATAIAGTSSKAAPAVPLYVNQAFEDGTDLTRQADAATFTTSAALKEKVVKFFVPAAALDTANGFDCLAVSTGASNAANITAATIRLVGPRYAQATPPNGAAD